MSTLKVDNIRHNSATSDAITMASDGTCTAKLTSIGGGGLSHRNLIINGAMNVAQRGVTSTSTGYQTVDRFQCGAGNVNENPTFAQVDVASGTTPYTLGFRKSLKITNGNQTSGAGAADRIFTQHKVEAQDMATSGWNYTSASSYITLSFWVKSSVGQNFYGFVYSADGTAQRYIFQTGNITANSWNKVVVSIPGGSNVAFDNNANEGLIIKWIPYYGTDLTNNSGTTLNTWANYNGGARTPDNTSTWYTTNNAQFEVTGVQLEVGSQATPFEHRKFHEELMLCQRYYQRHRASTYHGQNFVGRKTGSNTVIGTMYGFLPMRTAATGTTSGSGAHRLYRTTDGSTHTIGGVSATKSGDNYSVSSGDPTGLTITVANGSGVTSGNIYYGKSFINRGCYG